MIYNIYIYIVAYIVLYDLLAELWYTVYNSISNMYDNIYIHSIWYVAPKPPHDIPLISPYPPGQVRMQAIGWGSCGNFSQAKPCHQDLNQSFARNVWMDGWMDQ